jgi:hypothetical protein
MNFNRIASKAIFAAASTLIAAAAFAHPALVSSTPQDKSQGASPEKIELTFTETLSTQFSGANLVMTSMPGMANHTMKIKATVAPGADGKTMVVTPSNPLTTGSYRVEWRAVSADTHPIKGSISFDVK